MPLPASPRLSDQMLPLIAARVERCRRDPGLGRALLARALADFGGQAGVDDGLAAALLARIRAVRPRVEHVILVPSRDLWLVVEEDALRAALPPETTIRLYYGQPGRMDESSVYPSFDLGRSLPLLLLLLRELAPATVYARGSAQFRSQHVCAAVKASLPELFLAFEVYDYAGMFDDETLACWGCTPETAGANRDAEAFLGLHADFVIDKTPGREWAAAAGALFTAPRAAWFPTLGTRCEPRPPLPRAPGPVRVLCAGSMPYFRNYVPGEGFPEWSYQNIVDPLVTLSRAGDVHVDIFNASHDPRLDHWPAFGGYAGLFDPRRVRYAPRIPIGEVTARMPGYDFGMFYFRASRVPIDYPLQQSLPNRCMIYLAGELPIIVNREMACVAELVERFGAGIVLASTEEDRLPGLLRTADLEAMRAGAAGLRRHLADLNARAMEAFRLALSQRDDRVR
jgi:hypothetical protein